MDISDLDSRLLTFAEQMRLRTESQIAVEDNKVVVGLTPNCAILFVNESDGRIGISFHRECHPLSVVTTLVILLDTMDPKDLNFTNCFLADIRGILSYEPEPGFDLLHVQYLRDLLGIRAKNIFTA